MNGRRFATETPLCNEKGGGRYALNVRTSAYSFGINDRTYKKEKQNNDNKNYFRDLVYAFVGGCVLDFLYFVDKFYQL